MSYEHIRVDLRGPIGRLTLDRADERNAMTLAMGREIERAVADFNAEDGIRVVVVAGAGKAFSAGGDFDWFPTLRDLTALDHLRRDAKQLVWDLLDVELPIVCAVNGAAAGLGASIALLCDVIFMSRSAVILDPHVRVGVVAGDGGTVVWPMAMGPARAKQYLLTGDPVSAEEAERLGLVNFVCEPERLESEALEFARRLAAGAPLAIRYTKQAVNKLVKDALNVAFDTSTALEIVTFQSEDHREALAAIREKRKPRFRGR